MRGSRALAILLDHDLALAIVLPSSASNKKIEISKNKLHLTGIHMNAMEFNSDSWEVALGTKEGVAWIAEI